jgi:mono/diheme cytochrome c family protein
MEFAIMRTILALAIAAVMATAAAAQQPTKGDSARGRIIANTWCSGCHLVAAGETRSVVADVPTFTSIAGRLPTDVDVLAAFIANPHPPMPNLSLTRQDILDVLAYIAALK